MSLVINTNLASQNAQRQLMRSGVSLDLATQRLSSGKRINSAADDAAGMAISNRMTSQVRGLDQAIRNANDGISLIQVAEGALGETSNMLQRIRELAIQSSNGIYSDGDRATLNAEVKQLLSQIDFVAKNTQFNGVNILDGSQGKVDLQVGADANQTVSLKIPAVNTATLGLGGQSSDVVGTGMTLDSAGTFTQSISAGAIKINGQSLGAINTDTKVQDVLEDINSRFSGIEAGINNTIVATNAGTGVIQGSNSLTIGGTMLDGSSISFTVANTNNMNQLVDKINQQTAGLATAALDETGKLVLTSDQFTRLTFIDNTGGVATGVSPGANPDPDISAIVQALQTYWISEAENLISSFFGMTGDGRDLTLNLQTIANGQSDGPNGALASVNSGTFTLNIDMADFGGVALPDGPLVGGWLYGDRIIAHEMVHAVMASRMNLNLMNGWFTEGAAELIHGADDRVYSDINLGSQPLNTLAEFQAAWDAAQNPADPGGALGYSVGYVATKMLHQSILTHSGAGISEVFDRMELGNTFDQALQFVASANGITAWTDEASFESLARTNGFNFMTGAADATLDAAVGVGKRLDLAGNLAQTDTGSIMGSDYGFSARNTTSVMPNLTNSPAQNFNFIIPAEYSAGSLTQYASLSLASSNGEKIEIEKGRDATDADLQALGFVETSGSNILGSDLNSSEQSTALTLGDLIINGVDISATLSADGLQGKINAINAKSDETGVSASTLAKVTYIHDSTSRQEVIHNNVVATAPATETIGFNGVGVSITAGDSLHTVSSKVNNASSATGVTSYVDEAGKIHFFSKNVINFSGSALNTALGLAYGPASTGSIKIKGSEVSLTNIYDINAVVTDINSSQAITGVRASVNNNGELQFESPTGFSFQLGNTNGLKTFQALGLTVTAAASGADLSDVSGDDILTNESVMINARIQLHSQNDQAISVRLTTNGEIATGLLEQNAAYSDLLTGDSLTSLQVSSVKSAQQAITSVDNALKTINDVRSQLGAVNNRLDFTIANLSNIAEKTTAALSRIVDADYAEETAKLSRAQVLQQASQAMLAQANARPEQILALLR